MPKPRRKKMPVMDVPENFNPSYKQYQELKPYLTSKGKVVSRSRSGLSQKMQKKLAQEIKRARHLALLPFVSIYK